MVIVISFTIPALPGKYTQITKTHHQQSIPNLFLLNDFDDYHITELYKIELRKKILFFKIADQSYFRDDLYLMFIRVKIK